MDKRTKETAKTGATPAPVSAAAAAPSERYERRDGVGFYLVKTLKDGTTTEVQLSNFTVEIIEESQGEDEKGYKQVKGFLIDIRFEDLECIPWLPAEEANTLFPGSPKRGFDDRLLEEALKIHPRVMVYPGKERHFVAAIKTLSKPRVFVVRKADSKTNDKTRKGNREA